jgi:hypothetical protein
MKLKSLFLILFVAGVAASIAVAKPPPGKGNPHRGGSEDAAVAATTTGSTTGSTTTGTTATTTTGVPPARKVLICHRTGNGRYVLVSVSVNSALARGKKSGDVPAAGGKCPGATGTTTGTTTTGTTATTTTTG